MESSGGTTEADIPTEGEGSGGRLRQLTVYLSISDSKRVAITVAREATASQFRAAASAATGIPPSVLKLIFGGRLIHDDDDTAVFNEFNIEDGRVVHCLGNPVNGSAVASPPAADASVEEAAVSGHAREACDGSTDSDDNDDDPLADAPNKVLIMAVYNEDWEEARRILGFGIAARRLAEYRDDAGQTALHCALTRTTPPDILRSLALLYPGAFLLALNRNSTLPLLLASRDETALQILDACPRVASMTDDRGETLLHQILRNFRVLGTAAVVRELLHISPAVIHAFNCNGESPLHLFFRKSNWRDDYPPSAQVKSDDKMMEMSSRLLRASLLGRTADDDDDAHPWLMLHASIRARECPWSCVLNFFRRRYRGQSTEKDAGANWPLHLICASDKPRDAHWREALGEILREYPGAASKANDDGNLPLHLVFGSKTSFEEPALEEVFEAFPEALSVKNKRGHAPLQVTLLEAPDETDWSPLPLNVDAHPPPIPSNETNLQRKHGKAEDVEELSRINSIFWLLKKDPGMIDVALSWKSGKPHKKMRM